jgi:hypothetical protein
VRRVRRRVAVEWSWGLTAEAALRRREPIVMMTMMMW